MTREEMKRLLDSPVMRAWADGGTLQFKAGKTWIDVESAGLTPATQCPELYRIKPEPKYRPWTPEEAVKHIGHNIETDKGKRRIYAVTDTGVLFGHEGLTGSANYEELLQEWTLSYSCKPCGTEVVDAG